MSKADLARRHRRRALRDALHLLAHTNSSSGRPATQVAVGLDPCDRAVEALPVVLIGLGERGGEDRELELVLVDLLAPADQLSSDLLAGPGCNSPHPTLHIYIIRTNVWSVK